MLDRMEERLSFWRCFVNLSKLEAEAFISRFVSIKNESYDSKLLLFKVILKIVIAVCIIIWVTVDKLTDLGLL